MIKMRICGHTHHGTYRLYAKAKGSMAFIIPEDFMTSEGITNTVDPND